MAKTAEEIEAENLQLKKQLESAEKFVNDATSKLEQYQKNDKSIKPEVKIGKITYEVNHGVNFESKVYSAQDIAANQTVAAKLVKAESSAISEKVAPTAEATV